MNPNGPNEFGKITSLSKRDAPAPAPGRPPSEGWSNSYGSGNPGATNVLRTGNKAAALLREVGETVYEIGDIVEGEGKVIYR